MRFDKFTLKVQEAIQEAQALAGQQGHQALDVEHLFLALLKQPEGIVSEIIKKLGADPRRIEGEVRKALERLPKVEGVAGGQTYMTPGLNRLLDAALSEAARLTDEYVSAEHVLIAMTEEKQVSLQGYSAPTASRRMRSSKSSWRSGGISGSPIPIRRKNIRR